MGTLIYRVRQTCPRHIEKRNRRRHHIKKEIHEDMTSKKEIVDFVIRAGKIRLYDIDEETFSEWESYLQEELFVDFPGIDMTCSLETYTPSILISHDAFQKSIEISP